MLLNEIHGVYYDIMAEAISLAIRKELTYEKLNQIVQNKGFGESITVVIPKVRSQIWPLLEEYNEKDAGDKTKAEKTNDKKGGQIKYKTTIRHIPHKELTLLQKRWLKAILLDPRIKLFDVSPVGLEDIEPLFTQDQFVYFDRYNNGDPFEDEDYINRFKTILKAIQAHRQLEIEFVSSRNNHLVRVVDPVRLEYSNLEDKFRLYCESKKNGYEEINLGRITNVQLLGHIEKKNAPVWKSSINKEVIVDITDDKNTLERAMLKFSYLQKETERIDDNHYRMTLHCRPGDETELVINLLSFGRMVHVVSPDKIVQEVRKRIIGQKVISARDS